VRRNEYPINSQHYQQEAVKLFSSTQLDQEKPGISLAMQKSAALPKRQAIMLMLTNKNLLVTN
jgi:hypothetical protein